ncbi:rhodanese-related sulfurtransferase [Chryseobacterium defluvii]|uniref:Rhodanese-related sulfurtransferase n=1 Tax=Chryseobacterium defluvii TaxID=160396 RepID=A0A840KBK9_9FLAO|nr:rhodanese-like domain-containing protein [Chryseobacterium defluvii]MBB4805855.1 rhodanese-related sulfurtransferase [Chryseobacterium defluvii]
MNKLLSIALLSLIINCGNAQELKKAHVDFDYLQDLVTQVKPHREKRLIDLDEFLKRSKQKNTVILDTRSKEMFDKKHVKGAVNINFSDFTQSALDNFFRNYEGKNTRILIYCNNNFEDRSAADLQDQYFITKAVQPRSAKITENNSRTLALNIPTYINLFGYGYKNVFELHELVDVNDPRIEFEGTDSKSKLAVR